MAYADEAIFQLDNLRFEVYQSGGSVLDDPPSITIRTLDDDPNPTIVLNKREAEMVSKFLSVWLATEELKITRNGCYCTTNEDNGGRE